MRRLLLTASLVLAVIAAMGACADRAARDREREDWNEVLALKAAYLEADPEQAPARKQAWVDAVRSFVLRYPGHQRATLVFEEIQLEFARDLANQGRLQAAERYYLNILSRNPGHTVAVDELATVQERIELSSNLFARVQTGMTSREVLEILGPPPPGWIRTMNRDEESTESWHYRRPDGHLATIYFSDGLVLATDYGPSGP